MYRQTPRKRVTVSVAGLLVVWAGLLTGCQETSREARRPPTVPVTVSVPIERETVKCEDFTGRTEAVESVEVRARVTGYLNKVCFVEGSEVKQGDLLFEIDPRPFQATYDRQLALIGSREADLKLREADLARAKSLLPQKAISVSDYDRTVAAHDQATSELAAARAAAEEAKLDLDFTRLTAPIAGEISRAQVTPGNLVKADQTLLTTVVSVDPIYVYFDVDEQTILALEQAVREGQIRVEGEKKIQAWMGLVNEEGYPHEGFLDFAENRFDSGTGTIRVRGVFENPRPKVGNRPFMPGLFARVRVRIGQPYKALMIAERALGSDQGQKYVLVVNAKNEVEYRRVTVGRLEGQLREIREGLKGDEHVIVNGQLRVRPGDTVAPKLVAMETWTGDAPAETTPAEATAAATSDKPHP
jgi:RND family efflux transporter MFP subunit